MYARALGIFCKKSLYNLQNYRDRTVARPLGERERASQERSLFGSVPDKTRKQR